LEDTIKGREAELNDLKNNFEGLKREHINLLNANDDL